MAVDDHPGTGNEQAVLALIDAAAALLGRHADIPKTFIVGLFARAVPEDFLSYEPREVAALAERAWSLLAVRAPGAPKIRFEPQADAPHRLTDISVLEVVNADISLL